MITSSAAHISQTLTPGLIRRRLAPLTGSRIQLVLGISTKPGEFVPIERDCHVVRATGSGGRGLKRLLQIAQEDGLALIDPSGATFNTERLLARTHGRVTRSEPATPWALLV